MTDHSTATLVWQTDPPSREIIATVRERIAKELKELDEPSELMFHRIWFGKMGEGPEVILTGNDEVPNAFNAEFYPEGYEGMTFKLDDFPNIREGIEEAMKELSKEDSPEGKLMKDILKEKK